MTPLQVSALMAAGIHLPLALMVWSLLRRRWPRRPLLMWVGGSLAMGLGATLFAAQGQVLRWASFELAGALLSVAPALRIAALRFDLGRDLRARWLAGFCLADYALFLYTLYALDEETRTLLGFCTMGAWATVFAWHAACVGRAFKSRNGVILAIAEGLFAAALALRVVSMAAGWTDLQGLGEGWDFALLVATGVAAALYGNLGYLGLVLDRIGAQALAAREAELTETQRRQAAEGHARELSDLLRQREQMMHMLAHEIRQPLHNAGIALQSASLHLDGPAEPGAPADALAATRKRLQRAQEVLLGVQSVLDNTLASAALLARQEAPPRVPTDLDLVLGLSVGDLPAALRQQLVLERAAGPGSALLDPGMVRLALRNLLLNAFTHGGPDVRVRLQVHWQIEPKALTLRVVDDGPGAPAQCLAAVQQHDAPTQPGLRRRQGLAIVQRVMQLHGGQMNLLPASPRGLVAELVFPQSPSP